MRSLSLVILVCLFLTSGCASYRYTSTLRSESTDGLDTSVKYNIKDVNYDTGKEFNTMALGLPLKCTAERLMEEAERVYPDIFSDDPSALPIKIDVTVDAKNNGVAWMMRYLASGGILTLVLPNWMTNETNFTVRVSIRDKFYGVLLDEKHKHEQKTHTWMTFFTPLGLIPIPGASDYPKVSDASSGEGMSTFYKNTRRSLLAATVKLIKRADQQKLAAAYKLQNNIREGVIETAQGGAMQHLSQSVQSKNKTFPQSSFDLKRLPKSHNANPDAVAVVIGNGDYTSHNADVPDAPFAHNDADAIAAYLINSLGFSERNIILLKDAGQGDMINVFGTDDNPKGRLNDWVRQGRSDIFVYYSGHGAPALKSGKGYLLPVDSDPEKIELNGYPLETLYANLAKQKARSVSVILDASFSGTSHAGAVIKSASSISLKRSKAKGLDDIDTILISSDVKEVSSWDEETKMGLFTRAFLEGVSGDADSAGFGNNDGKVTLSELKKYLSEEVPYASRRFCGREQTPQVSGTGDDVLAELTK